MASRTSAISDSRLPALAAAAPLLCAVHCIASPLLVIVAPTVSLGGPFETGIKLASAVLAAVFLVFGVRAHGRRAVVAPVALGLALWLAAAGTHGLAEVVLSALGGILQAAGLAWSAALRHKAVCHTCACPGHPS